jgi:hypothetical protein
MKNPSYVLRYCGNIIGFFKTKEILNAAIERNIKQGLDEKNLVSEEIWGKST